MRLLSLLTLLGTAAIASAQYGGTPYGQQQLNYLPNYYNRAQQPLSPYLNLMRGFNPSLNYYYGTRPGTPAGGVNVFGQAPAYNPYVGPAAGGFLPQAQQPADGTPSQYPTGGQPVALRSAGVPVSYGNQFLGHGSYLSVGAAGQMRGGQRFAGQQQSSTQGVGTVPPPRK